MERSAQFSPYTYNYFLACPNCEGRLFRNMGKGTNRKNHFHKMIVRCSNCGLYFANPIADRKSMEKYYASYGDTHFRNADISESSLANTRRVVEQMENRCKPPHRFLDIGSASGEQMAAFKSLGWASW